MALTKEEILDAIASMTVLEVSELIKMMEEKFGVSAAAAAVAVAPAAGGAAAPAAEEKSEFDVVLADVGSNMQKWHGIRGILYIVVWTIVYCSG